MDEDERSGRLGRRPEGTEALVAEIGAARRGGHLDTAETAVRHQLLELLRPGEVDGAEGGHPAA